VAEPAPSLRRYLSLLEAEARIGDWPGRPLWHGTTPADAKRIITHGIKLVHRQGSDCGIHLADDPALVPPPVHPTDPDADVPDNSAAPDGDATDDPASVVLEFRLTDQARILDLRQRDDRARWTANRYDRMRRHANGAAMLVKHGVDGVYDRSSAGLRLFNPKAVRFVRVWSGVVSDALADAINPRLGELDEFAIGGLRRCTAVTANALLKHFAKPAITLAKVPETDLGVLRILTEAGLAYQPAATATGRTVQQFIALHGHGAWYLVTPGHAMALVDGNLFDAENRGPDGRKLVQAYAITRR
jgi:hypothetical protein